MAIKTTLDTMDGIFCKSGFPCTGKFYPSSWVFKHCHLLLTFSRISFNQLITFLLQVFLRKILSENFINYVH